MPVIDDPNPLYVAWAATWDLLERDTRFIAAVPATKRDKSVMFAPPRVVDWPMHASTPFVAVYVSGASAKPFGASGTAFLDVDIMVVIHSEKQTARQALDVAYYVMGAISDAPNYKGDYKVSGQPAVRCIDFQNITLERDKSTHAWTMIISYVCHMNFNLTTLTQG